MIVWKILTIFLLSALATVILIGSVNSYTTKPVFLLLTALTIAATLLGGAVGGLISLALSVAAFRYSTAAFDGPVEQRLFANVCVDLTFIALITYLRFLADGRERARVAAESRTAELAAALDIARLGVWEYDAATDLICFDGRCREVFGITETVAVSRERVLGLIHADDRARFEADIRHALAPESAGVHEAEYRITRPDGAQRWVAVRGNAIASGEAYVTPKKLVGTLMDITEQKCSQELLIRTEKVAALGRMAATLAHDINNPLAAVTNTLFLARSASDCPKSLRKYLELADEQLRQVSQITRTALGFYRENSAPSRVVLADVLNETEGLFSGKIRSKQVRFEKEYQSYIEVAGRGGELRQVFSNLIANGLDAVANHGRIKVRVSISINPNTGETRARITVADDGNGIETAARKRVFEPLFTTKGAVGTGLGLWVSKQLVENHGGTIRFRSGTNGRRKGTTFSILLPCFGTVANKTAPSKGTSHNASTAKAS